jgi:hypothetical protein
MNCRNMIRLSLITIVLMTMVFMGCSDSSTGPGGGSGDPEGDSGIWYVDVDATGTGSGRSWGNAFNHPADAMAAASAGEQIWVAEGTYYGPGDRHTPVVAFKDSVSLYGGFEGGETDLSQRDYLRRARFDGGDSLYHVVIGSWHALLHGIIIQKGSATNLSSADEMRGGGLYCRGTEMRISQCTIQSCEAYFGGGIYSEGGTVTVDSCVIDDNRSHDVDAEGAGGGGINVNSGSIIISSCTITDNTSAIYGGGLLCRESDATVSNTTICLNNASYPDSRGGGVYFAGVRTSGFANEFIDCHFCSNHAQSGGGVYTDAALADFIGCTFNGNMVESGNGAALYSDMCAHLVRDCMIYSNADDNAFYLNGPVQKRIFNCLFYDNGSFDTYGGAITNHSSGTIIQFCTIAYNTANSGGGIFSLGGGTSYVENCIIWGNQASVSGDQIYDAYGATTNVYWTDIDQDGYALPGSTNLRIDPLFAWVGMSGVYYLSHIAAGEDSDSPCIDRGSDTAAHFGLDTLTTRTDFATDTGTADLGFHHRP